MSMSLATGTLLAQSDEYYFCFQADSKIQIDSISQMISIDRVVNGKVWAYANSEEMQRFAQTGIMYEFCSKNNSKSSYEMAATISQMQNWDMYPTYNVYDSMMHKYAADHSDICSLETVGTLPSGRQILALKISRDVYNDRTEKPEALCSGGIHGDECVGMVMALHLCDFLLNNANNSGKVQNLIDNVELWVIPLLNPDGMYAAGNGTISGCRRNNGNSVDLNRSFPSINNVNQNYDEASLQKEIVYVMDFFRKHHISISINYHSGGECFNYPWDTWRKRCADDDWWQMVGGAYRDTVQYYSPSGYFDDDCGNNANGVTNGWDWYSVGGSMQDYANYYEHCREVTVELSSSKIPYGSALPDIWEYNRRSVVNFLSESLNGIRGIVTDVSGVPISARITVDGHDADNSWVETDVRAGDYHRMIKSGNYRIICDAEGYMSKTVSDVKVVDGQPTVVNIVLENGNPEISVSTKKLEVKVNSDGSAIRQLIVSNIGDVSNRFSVTADTTGWLSVDKWHGVLDVGARDTVSISLSSWNLKAGKYLSVLQFESVSQTTTVNVEMEVLDSADGSQEQDPTECQHTVTSVSIAELPVRLEYGIGDNIDLSGGKIAVTYANDSVAYVNMSENMISNFDSNSSGKKNVSVKFENFIIYFNVTVMPENVSTAVKKVTVCALPAKLYYQIGDTLDCSGGKLLVIYDNDSSAIVGMDNDMVSGFESGTFGSKQLTVSYGAFSISFYVNVSQTLSLSETGCKIYVYASGKTIIVKNAPCEVSVYDAMGNCVAVGHQGDSAINIGTAGLYIVKTGNFSCRIVVE